MEFEDTPVSVIVEYLDIMSEELDPYKWGGVNILLRLNAKDTANVPKFTLMVDKIPLGEAIKYICKLADLKYKIEKNAVVLASQDIALDELETRTYPIGQKALAK